MLALFLVDDLLYRILTMTHHEEDFKDTTSTVNVLMIIVAMVAMPLLPMLMGWFTLLR